MSSLVFTRSPQPYFPFPIRVTIAGDGLGMSLRIYCRLGYRINTKYLFTFRLCAFGRLPVTLLMFWRLQSQQVFFSSWAIFRSWSFRTLVVYIGIICANPPSFCLVNQRLFVVFVCLLFFCPNRNLRGLSRWLRMFGLWDLLYDGHRPLWLLSASKSCLL